MDCVGAGHAREMAMLDDFIRCITGSKGIFFAKHDSAVTPAIASVFAGMARSYTSRLQTSQAFDC